ncbi:MAG: hypothetical protein Q8P92_04190 [Candidatus Daviesbacteria bacterium]|nr:hypothetical protein [Candidatus Daviesbacteria bacterium]
MPTSTTFSAGQRGIIHIPIIIVFLLALGLMVVGNVQTTTEYDPGDVQGLIAKGGENSGKGSENRGGPPEEVRIKQEIRTADQEIKREIREDRVRVDVSQSNAKSKIHRQNNEIIIQTEVESEIEDEATESADDDDDEDEDEDEETEVVAELRAISKFPLRIDTSTNQLIMTKNGVERVLTILPAHAVQNMLRAHLKKGLGPKFFEGATPSATPEGSPSASPSASPTEEPEATESAELTILESDISLEELDSQIVYKIPAKKHLKVLGFIPINTDLTGYVSAETGILLEERQSFWARLLDLLSP